MDSYLKCVELLVESGIPQNEAEETANVVFKLLAGNPQEMNDIPENGMFDSIGSEEERYVFGPALIPNHVDAHGNIFPERTVRATAYNFMRNYQHSKFMHLLGLSKDDVSIVESYVLKYDAVINNKKYKKGSWMMGVIVHNDKIWNYIKEGKIKGYSIGGKSIGAMINVQKGNTDE